MKEDVARNITMDYFKILLSILVITIHAQPIFYVGSFWGDLISNGLARMAVPLFFIINGFYFASKIDDKQAIKKYSLHIFLLYLIWAGFYFPIYKNWDNILVVIILGFYHLWYLIGLLTALLILIFLRKIILNDWIILVISISPFIVAHILESYSENLHVFRNGIFLGLPFFAMGYMINKKKLFTLVNKKQIAIIAIIAILAMIIDSSFTVLERKSSEFYLSLLIACPAIFIFVLNFSKKVKGTKTAITNELSSAIYFIHLLIILIVDRCTQLVYFPRFISIVFLSIISGCVIVIINKRIKILL